MKNKSVYILDFLMLLFIFFIKIIFIDNFTKYYEVINALFWVITCFIVYKKFGFPKDNSVSKNNVTGICIIAVLLFTLLTSLSGMYFGFLKNAYSLTISNIISNTYSLIIMILSQELIRYMVSFKCRKDKSPLIILTILFITLDIILAFNSAVLLSGVKIFIFITNICLPIIARHTLCTYLTYQVSYIPSLIVRLFFALYIYIFPIFPDYGYYISSIIGVLVPYLIYLATSKIIQTSEHKKIKPIKKSLWYINVPLTCLGVILILLVSGISKYQIMAIGSGSMEKYIYKGDAVVFEKLDTSELDNLKEKDIIVFRHNGKYVTHRIVDIIIEEDKTQYQTKGDNNSREDEYLVQEEDIEGIVLFRIKGIGLPSIWFQELIK